MSPPLPDVFALASIVDDLSIETVSALRSGPLPCWLPPMLIVPPPAKPEASRVADASVMSLPVTTIEPPDPFLPFVSIFPDILTEPPEPPPRTIEPL